MRVAIAAALVVCGLTLTAKAQAAADPWITAKVKMELWSTKGVPSTHINVDTNDGLVTLYGKVRTQADRALAQEATHRVKGVQKVTNLLQVVPKVDEKAVAKSDADIKQEVTTFLKNDVSLAGSSISVKAVDKGVVLLSGKTDSFMGNYEAQADAYYVDGVRQVSSEVTAPQGFVVEEWSFFAPTETPTSSDRQVTKDVGITTAIKEKLAADAAVPSTRVYVDTNRGDVLLFGTVSTDAQKMAAEKDAKTVSGATMVTNEIDVKKTADKVPIVKDDAVASSVKKLLAKDQDLSKVEVKVNDGTVMLTGNAPSSWERAHAALLSREAQGVKSVDNEVKISKN